MESDEVMTMEKATSREAVVDRIEAQFANWGDEALEGFLPSDVTPHMAKSFVLWLRSEKSATRAQNHPCATFWSRIASGLFMFYLRTYVVRYYAQESFGPNLCSASDDASVLAEWEKEGFQPHPRVDEARPLMRHSYPKMYQCVLCGMGPGQELFDTEEEMLKKHGIDLGEENSDMDEKHRTEAEKYGLPAP